ncbi:hypothetical protein F2Q69_00024865 [Brassica cretica]|uniref:Uncharacterized protein n=1 Tax=Brassica cretica TaxID=69181 RepID=A0A8S9QD31_BRACR|nr:hypothetical protein F2Q69_00024865 [Brassica cretica]
MATNMNSDPSIALDHTTSHEFDLNKPSKGDEATTLTFEHPRPEARKSMWGVMIPTCSGIQAHNTPVPFTTHTIQSLFMTQEFFTQFTAAARYIWGGFMIHNIQYEVSENTSDVVYKIITLSVLGIQTLESIKRLQEKYMAKS